MKLSCDCITLKKTDTSCFCFSSDFPPSWSFLHRGQLDGPIRKAQTMCNARRPISLNTSLLHSHLEQKMCVYTHACVCVCHFKGASELFWILHFLSSHWFFLTQLCSLLSSCFSPEGDPVLEMSPVGKKVLKGMDCRGTSSEQERRVQHPSHTNFPATGLCNLGPSTIEQELILIIQPFHCWLYTIGSFACCFQSNASEKLLVIIRVSVMSLCRDKNLDIATF